MTTIAMDDPLAVEVIGVIQRGDVDALRTLLQENRELATALLGSSDCDRAKGFTRTLAHIVTDWPGHFPNGARTVEVLAEAGTDLDAWTSGDRPETPLHWAASSDDVDVLDALLDAGADIDAAEDGNQDHTPLGDATIFGQWKAAHRLVERGARTSLWDAAVLGLDDRVAELLAEDAPAAEVNRAFWGACHGGQRQTAEYLLGRGADPDWLPDWERATPLDAAERSAPELERAKDVVTWLRERGARKAEDLENDRTAPQS